MRQKPARTSPPVDERPVKLETSVQMNRAQHSGFLALSLVFGALAIYGVISMSLPGPARSPLRQFVNVFWPALVGLSVLCLIRARRGPFRPRHDARALLIFAGVTVAAFLLLNGLGLGIDAITHATGEGGVGEGLLYLSVLVAPAIGTFAAWLALRRGSKT